MLEHVVFVFKADTNVWESGKFTLYSIEDSRWILKIDKKVYKHESIWDVLDVFNTLGLWPTFKLPSNMEDVNGWAKHE